MGYIGNAKTSYDAHGGTYFAWTNDVEYKEKMFYVDIVPQNKTTLLKNIIIKSKNSDMTLDVLEKKFNYLLQVNGKQVAKLKALKSGHVIIEKLYNDD
mgnify:CR=1 FL=1